MRAFSLGCKQTPQIAMEAQWVVCLVLSLCLFTDDFVYSFPLTFLPQQLEILNYSSTEIAIVVGAFAWANQIAFIMVTVHLFIQAATAGSPEPPQLKYMKQMRLVMWSTMAHYVSLLVCAMFPAYNVILVGRMVQGFVSPFISVYSITLAAQIFPSGSQRGLAIAIVMSGNTGGDLVGRFLGGYMFSFGSYLLTYVAAAAIAAFNVWCLFFAALCWAPEQFYMVAETSKCPKSSWRVASWLLSDPIVWNLCGVVLVATTVKTTAEIVLPLYMQNEMAAKETLVSLLAGLLAVSFVVSSMFLGWLLERVSARPMIFWSFFLMAFAVPLQIWWPKTLYIALFLVLYGVSLGGTLSPSCTAITAYAEHHDRLRNIPEDLIVAVYHDFWALGLVLGAALAGIPGEFDSGGQQRMLVGCGVGLALFGFLYYGTTTKLDFLKTIERGVILGPTPPNIRRRYFAYRRGSAPSQVFTQSSMAASGERQALQPAIEGRRGRQ
ncbi:unnamed protein product [Vitrella brassicaformis CCMP3155]|uniref:Major facilitator superfamily (MFS) profile domain-containing protein n=1 Tax=Vitrella brassicaformis (strain CCMP3155) TaxID=1169540 RepID=A0A0G4FAH0_VITBC|nr:unnamed protein product [Vitrella brassicaformis CCMP3155]|eukprot:CEM09980.1 unnamed protein product [Vitrella brassicaformis CCMP3155]